jgi:hypothetical protein
VGDAQKLLAERAIKKSAANSKARAGAAVSIASTLFAVSRRDDGSGKDGGSGGARIGGQSFWKIARPHSIRLAARRQND